MARPRSTDEPPARSFVTRDFESQISNPMWTPGVEPGQRAFQTPALPSELSPRLSATSGHRTRDLPVDNRALCPSELWRLVCELSVVKDQSAEGRGFAPLARLSAGAALAPRCNSHSANPRTRATAPTCDDATSSAEGGDSNPQGRVGHSRFRGGCLAS